MPKTKVLITTRLPGYNPASFDDSFAITYNQGDDLNASALIEAAKDQDALICTLANKISDSFLSSCPNLKIVANVAVGIDNINLEAANQKEILVANTPGVLDDTTADLAFALLLALARRLKEAEKYLLEKRWKDFKLDHFFGVDVHGKTLGVIGCGRIGQAVARRAKGFSMHTLYHQRNRLAPELERELGLRYVSLGELLSNSDFISLNCPLTADTHHLIGEAEFALIKPGCQLINTARGPIVDEQALIKALSSGQLKGAALDVFEHEPNVPAALLAMDNVILVPHIGSATPETRSAMANLAIQAVVSAFKGNKPDNLVNPHCWRSFLARNERTK
ncbi:MAG: D-glycerate dehydrogenase [Candidatus Obscuribacterales bacterium]|nr:D-glycerate dehydrogenase [Candidatus Obscuribacterales bacterium]